MDSQTSFSALSIVAFVWFSWVLYTCVYRLWFHPLARFPGPKLAALTTWYEGYYDCLQYKGRFTFKLGDLHEKYGTTFHILEMVADSNMAADSCSARPKALCDGG